MNLLAFLRNLSACLMLSAAVYAQTPLHSANWISPGFTEDTMRSSVVFQRHFVITKPVKTATMLISAHGLYESAMNGKRVGDAYFTPGFTNYNKRIAYQEYDMKDYLKHGDNLLRVVVGEGWYRGVFGGMLASDNYGSDASIIGRLTITYYDGTHAEIVTDSSWRSSTDKIQHADIYNGEMIDYTKKYNRWYPVVSGNYSKDILFPSDAPPVRKHETFKPVAYLDTPAGDQVIDFGQNLAGWVVLRVKGKRGDTIRVEHAEVLDKQGNFYTTNLREAKATDTYILSGDGVEVLEPHFTWHGFRYVRVSGVDMKRNDATAVALYSDLVPVGSFECSDSLVNKLYKNITWSLKSNILDIPTDCPQRSERLGWTADAQVFLGTAAYMYDVRNFYRKWMADLASEQRPDGYVPNVIPYIYYKIKRPKYVGVAGWGDAATIVPMALFNLYNDTAVVREHYPVMKQWIEHIRSNASGYLWEVPGYGDWLAPGDSTSLPFIDQCFWFQSVNKLVEAALLLGNKEDAGAYSGLASQVQHAFMQKYVAANGQLVVNTQTACVLALKFGLLPDSLRPVVAGQLAQLIKKANDHLATGFLGTPYLLQVLSDNGYNNLTYRLLLQQTYPSWLYAVTKGATTIWERWDAIKPDGDVMAISYNHYAYGAVGEWLYGYAAGIRSLSPGYREILVEPHPGPGLSWVNCSHQCAYGTIASNWQVTGTTIRMQVKIPKGTRAVIAVPGKGKMHVGAGAYSFEGTVKM